MQKEIHLQTGWQSTQCAATVAHASADKMNMT